MKKQILLPLFIFLFLLLGTTVVIFYGRGYRFGFDNGKPDFLGTGLLVTTSTPDGAQVFINGNLTTATDNTINLAPGEYEVKIFKEGYFPWQKKIKVQKEVVAKADALLLPSAPKLESITAIGVQTPAMDPSGTKLAYTVASQSAKKNGVYILDMTNKPILTLQSASYQVADDTTDTFSGAMLGWSPDGRQLIATIGATFKKPITYLLDAASLNDNPQNITATLDLLTQNWDKEKQEKETARLATLKPALKNFLSNNITILQWSMDETKILYQATTSATLPIIITPRLLGTNPTPEERIIQKDNIYVYDLKEDKNYKLNLANSNLENDKWKMINGKSPLSWFPDSTHLIYVHDKKIDIMEYDGTNQTTVYAGPFLDNYVFPWPNASKIVILTDLGNPSITPNLYTISLK